MLFQRLGVDTRVVRQYLQTAVAFISSHSDSRNVGMRVRVSGGRRLMGANEFLSWRTPIEMEDNLTITRSIWKQRV